YGGFIARPDSRLGTRGSHPGTPRNRPAHGGSSRDVAEALGLLPAQAAHRAAQAGNSEPTARSRRRLASARTLAAAPKSTGRPGTLTSSLVRAPGLVARRVCMEKTTDEGLKVLLDSGKEKGYLTFSQVNDYLPDDAVNPEKLDQLLLLLEEQGIELIDETEAEEREGSPNGAATDDDTRGELDLSFMDEEDSRRIDDPVRMYLTQMGEIPLLK